MLLRKTRITQKIKIAYLEILFKLGNACVCLLNKNTILPFLSTLYKLLLLRF